MASEEGSWQEMYLIRFSIDGAWLTHWIAPALYFFFCKPISVALCLACQSIVGNACPCFHIVTEGFVLLKLNTKQMLDWVAMIPALSYFSTASETPWNTEKYHQFNLCQLLQTTGGMGRPVRVKYLCSIVFTYYMPPSYRYLDYIPSQDNGLSALSF